MSWFLAASLKDLRAEINKRWPNRDKASDGWVGDTSHQARRSDHNPDYSAPGSRRGVVRALDVDKDGIDVDLLLKHTTNDSRVSYVIYNRRIYEHPHGWYAYKGPNPHTSHVHISISRTSKAENDRKSWFGGAPASSGPTSSSGSSSSSSSSSGTGSIVEYLNSKGRNSSFSARGTLARKYGIRNYKGTAAQNTLLLSKVRNDDKKSSKVSIASSSKPSSSDPNKYTVRTESEIRKILIPRTTGTDKNSTPHLIGLYQLQQINPFPLAHDQIWGNQTDQHYRWVGQLQKHMNEWKGDKVEVDGSYGRGTDARVLDLQKRNEGGAYKGYPDGIAGPIFCDMLGIKNYPN